MTARTQLLKALRKIGLHEHARNLPKSPRAFNEVYVDKPAYQQLLALMVWQTTPQGHSYWQEACDRLKEIK